MRTISQPKRGRPPHKRETIVAEICNFIVSGQWQPSARIPTVLELSHLYGVGAPTMHQALKTLAAIGFIETRGGKGTFVTPSPPHLSRYALVFPGSRYVGWSRYWTALHHTAERIEGQDEHHPRQFPSYFKIDPHADSPDHKRLIEDLKLPALAGLIFANSPWNLGDSPLLTRPGIPRVAIADYTPGKEPPFPVRYPSLHSFYDRALDFLISPEGGNRRRIALLCFALTDQLVASFMQSVARRGATSKAYWIQAPQIGNALAIQHAVQCLFQGSRKNRPDALLIADDNLTEEATKGLVPTGLQAPSDLGVVSFCNFPDPPPAAVPVTRIGFDADAMLRECVECIDRQRRQEPVLPVRHQAATFENATGPAVWMD